MATIEITADALVVDIHGWDRVFTLRSQLTVPLGHVGGASSGEAEASKWYKGLRMGTNLPGLTAGAFYHHGGWVFWDVHDPALAVAIDLHDEAYRRLVIQVEDPAAAIATIEAAVRTRAETTSVPPAG